MGLVNGSSPMITLQKLQVLDEKYNFPLISLVLLDGKPISLGEGRFARVYLGATAAEGESGRPVQPDRLQPGQLLAIKFLKLDPSVSVRNNASYRFYREVDAMVRLARYGLSGVVGYGGYGRLSALPAKATTEMKLIEQALGPTGCECGQGVSPSTVFGSLTRHALDARFTAAGQPSAQPWTIGLTGDYYALSLCAMSVEDLLLHRGDPWHGAVGQAFAAMEINGSELQTMRSSATSTLLRAEIVLATQGTGFDDLGVLDKWFKNAPRPSRRFSATATFMLAIESLRLVKSLHAPDSTPSLSHRDLKPGNILVDLAKPSTLKLSDLGFVASVQEILAGNFTKSAPLDEGGVLPAGSRGYRAPEQLESGEELSFVRRQNHESHPSLVGLEVLSAFDTDIKAGDWIKWANRHSGTTYTERVFKSSHENGVHLCHLVTPPGTVPADELIKARLIKDVGMHSDVYACGCLTYYFGSHGKDPERFMRGFVDDMARSVLNSVLPPWITTSPHFLAAVLCMDDAEPVVSDLNRLADLEGWDRSERENLSIVAEALSDDVVFAVTRRGRVIRAIRKFRDTTAEIPGQRALLRCRNDDPITFPHLFLTLLCCMREGDAAIVKREADVFDKTMQVEAIYSRQAKTFASKILDRAEPLRSGDSLKFDAGALATLGDNAFEIFVTARLADRSKLVAQPVPEQASASDSAAESEAISVVSGPTATERLDAPLPTPAQQPGSGAELATPLSSD
jgi:serine/threonine protein kinase